MIKIKDISLSKKLIGGYVFVVILLAFVGIAGYNGVKEINNELDAIINDHIVMANAIKELKAANMLASDAIGEHILGNNEADGQIRAAYLEFDNQRSIIRSMALSDEERQDLENIEKLQAIYKENGRSLWDAITSANFKTNDDVNMAMKKYDASREELMLALNEFDGMQAAQMKLSEEAAETAVRESTLMIVLISIIAAITGIGIGFYISRSITRPVGNVVSGAKDIANGRLGVRVMQDSKDEIGELSKIFQNMADDLKMVIGDVNNVLNALSEGDLTKNIQVEGKGDFEKITTGIKKMQQSLQKLLITMRDSSEKVAISANELSSSTEEMKTSIDQISHTSQDICNGVTQQSSKIVEVTRAMKEMSESVVQVAANAQKAAESADEAHKTAREVGDMSQEVARKMSDIQKTVDSSATQIKHLDSKSQQIGEIIGVITNIADQTNLLALNAAIEAARAGEHGRGFAVVADEVRKLAEESRGAANKITDLIKEIQQGTKRSVECMGKGTITVNEGAKSIETTVTAINHIVKSAGDIAVMVQEIAASAEEQSSSIEEITATIEDVSAISEQSSAATQEASAAAEEQAASMEQLVTAAQELSNLSVELRSEVAKFNLGDTVGSSLTEPPKIEYKPQQKISKKAEPSIVKTSLLSRENPKDLIK